MRQLINHTSEVTAYAFEYFPYCFGEFSSIRYWVETNKTYGQRFCYKVRDPHRGVWTKTKESKYTHLVFMFMRNTGLILEQCIDLDLLSVEDILIIVENYIVSPYQKEAIQNYVSKNMLPMRTVWRDPEDLTSEVQMLNYDISQVTRRSKPNTVKFADDVVTGESAEDKETERLRRKLHHKDALDLPEGPQRDFFYSTMGLNNPDNFTPAQVRAMQ